MPLLNPMGLSGPNSTPPIQQPNTANPPANAAVANSPVGVDTLGLGYVTVPAKYRQPGISPGPPF
jgi:hypothetical protein